MASRVNKFLQYMEAELTALPDDVGTFQQRDIDRAVRTGRVRTAPVSVHRGAGHIYWLSLPVVESGLDRMAERATRYCGSTGEPPLIGSVDTLTIGDEFDTKTATLALAYGRERGLLKEYDSGGHSYFVVPQVEQDPRVIKFFGLK